MINIVGRKSNAGRVYVADGDSRRVAAASTYVQPGLVYCVTGITTGRTCGWNLQSVTGSYTDSATGAVAYPVLYARKTGRCTMGGDSGGPAYTASSDYVSPVGVHSGGGGGGSDSFAGTYDGDPCRTYDTQVNQIGATFGGSLRTS